jgi:hypothetical protein
MLYWTKLNPTVKIINTKKKFFNSYLYKIVIWCPGGRLILDRKSQDAALLLKNKISHLEKYHVTYNYGGSWFGHMGSMARSKNAELKISASVNQLQHLIDIKQTYNDQIKVRIEEPIVTIYCNDESLLYKLANNNTDRLREVHRPFDDKAVEVLNRGEIITKTEPVFSYKVQLKEFVFSDPNLKHNILDYLYNLVDDDNVCLTKSLIRQLNENHPYFSGAYFYTKDEKTLTFINLICPGLISGIFKLTKID